MKRIYLFLLYFFIINSLCFSQSINLEGIEIPNIKEERSDRVITHKGYTVSYNYDWKIPNWVAYELTDREVQGEVPRYDRFKPDPMVPQSATATTNDYKHSGYDRGHMAPAASFLPMPTFRLHGYPEYDESEKLF